jgi:hypothetical protein
MPKWQCTVTHTLEWEIEVDAEDEDEAHNTAKLMNREDLNKQSNPDETVDVDNIECVEDCDEEEENED